MITALTNAFVPIFAGLVLGYLAGLWKLVDNQNVRTLIMFVMSVALPCSLFSLTEYARSSAKLILVRTCTGPFLSDNPRDADLRSMAIPMEVC